ncbi:AAA family ATPase [Sulfurimonas sp. NW15]|uniref:McrB family protein n=1 Tax=Sulfurimonas sp. NW15 TaxID=2922729 RepID=UPI003DA966E5
MELTKEELKSLYEKDYSKRSEISQRFDEITMIVDSFLKHPINIYRNEMDNPFVGQHKGVTEGNSKVSYSNMINIAKDNDEKKQIENSWKLIAGYENGKPIEKYRITTNNITSPDYNGSIKLGGIYARTNGNFASNNYFFQIAYFLQLCEKNTFDEIVGNTKIVLSWQKDLSGKDDKEKFESSKKYLEKKFPPKFLWMWANKEEVLHPISLMAFRNFLDTEFGKTILDSIKKDFESIKGVEKNELPELVTNMKFDNFKNVWKKISDKILEEIVDEFSSKTDDKKKEIIFKLSKLISLICIEEPDIKNIADFLQTGNRAVILWGPPGTGKTYESEQVVKELLDIGDDELEKYLFSNKKGEDNTKGYYQIIQFHPNYTYQDFIGGISPKLTSEIISYELREGVFKEFCDDANKNKDKKYIFIIDEINRAELSAVFGELLYALEYRGKSINLPHFGSFVIPKNVYIIGTMNNVDKSLVTFDLALRRRFGFFKLMPKLEVIEDVLSEFVKKDSLDDYYQKCVELNQSITSQLGLSEDYQIGQAYFLRIKDFLDQNKLKKKEPQIITRFELKKLWLYNIEPLLEEYLGMQLEDDGIKSKLNALKKNFLKY